MDIKFETKDFKEAETIILPDKNRFQVIEYFADEIKGNKIVPDYTLNDDVKVRDDTYQLALTLIDEHLSRKEGDILIFVPGMFEIKYLKDMLIESPKVDPKQIIEVHSAYSEELYRRLFI